VVCDLTLAVTNLEWVIYGGKFYFLIILAAMILEQLDVIDLSDCYNFHQL
jgi:hypothetical protein